MLQNFKNTIFAVTLCLFGSTLVMAAPGLVGEEPEATRAAPVVGVMATGAATDSPTAELRRRNKASEDSGAKCENLSITTDPSAPYVPRWGGEPEEFDGMIGFIEDEAYSLQACGTKEKNASE
jgi:hypothetical protein